MNIKQAIDADLKRAMFARDSDKVTVLKGLKNVILYTEISDGVKEGGLSNDRVIAILKKEAKKCQESADLYRKAGDTDRQQAELLEKEIISLYLPDELPESELESLVDLVISEAKNEKQNMGHIISEVKSRASGRADGARVARLVKERLV